MAETEATRAERRRRIERMVKASAEADRDVGPDPLSPGEKLESLLHLAARLPATYTEELQYPPFFKRSER